MNNQSQGGNGSNNFPNEEMKKEIELENQIRDHLKCYICLTKVSKPKMCKFCKKICCEKCINKWLENHSFCGMCKHEITGQDMITLPFLDDMSTYFINNIDSHPKQPSNIINNNAFNRNKIMNIENNQNFQSNINNINNINKDENEENKNICSIHKNIYEFYCVHCDKYFCSNCLVFFGEEHKKHQNHIVLPISKMNDLGIKEALNEYRKLSCTKDKIKDFIGLCEFKLKENEIKKNQTKYFFNFLSDKYLNKIEENSKEIKKILDDLQNKNSQIEDKISTIPYGFNKIINNNDYAQGNIVFQDLKKYNKLDENIGNVIKERSKENPKFFYEEFETDFLEFDLPFSGQYNEGLEVANINLDFIPGFPSNFLLQYLGGQIVFSFSVDIDLPLNDPKYPKFYTYITLRNKKYGLEFYNLSNQSFPQDFPIQEKRNGSKVRHQINSNEFNAQQFIYLAGEDKKIRIKLYVIKAHYE